MAKQWYFAKNEQQYGPISAVELKQKFDSGELGPDDEVRPEDRQNWVKASTVKGLFAATGILPPSPPATPSQAPPALPATSVPPPPPVASSESPPHATTATDLPQQPIQPFSEWYPTTWLSHKSGRIQILVWAAFGFAWIPYWYFWMATPPGSIREKWGSLGLREKLGYALLTGLICLLALQGTMNRLSRPNGRELTVKVGTGGDYFRVLEDTLKNVRCYATSDTLSITMDVGSSRPWDIPKAGFPFIIRVFDKNGHHLTNIITSEIFTASPAVYNETHQYYEDLSKYSGGPKLILLKSNGNRHAYQVNVRDLRDASTVEVGLCERPR